MQADSKAHQRPAAFELRFDSLLSNGRSLAFPCDLGGHVDLDLLSERARNNYWFARAVVGREFSWPAVQRMPAALN